MRPAPPRRRGDAGGPHLSALQGRRAIVTGGARGIGVAIAERYRSEGASVATLDVLDGADVQADLADAADARRGVAEAIERLGGCDVLVNNAGIFLLTPLLDIEVEEWDAVFAVNVRAMLLTTQSVVPSMREAGGGAILNMASMGGKLAASGEAHYGSSKAAVIALTRCCAVELGPLGITVNCICPGFVATEMGADTRTPELVAAWEARSPLGRLATPGDVAGVATFLASRDGAYLTGEAVNVAGGMVMH